MSGIEFVSVRDRLPGEGQVIVATLGNNFFVGAYRDGKWELQGANGVEQKSIVTHWTPLGCTPERTGRVHLSYSGFGETSPLNISLDGKVYLIHAANHDETVRLANALLDILEGNGQ